MINTNNPYDSQLLHVRVNELQESLQLYERLHMKNEFLYTLRMYTMTLLHISDLLRLKELLLEYKFIITWEDERMLEAHNKSSGGNARGVLS